MASKLKPYIEIDYSWNWDCPRKNCDGYNSIEPDGGEGEFPTPLKCEDCGTEFDDYEYGN